MSETLRLTILYEDAEDGWIVASIPEVPGTHSQGHTRAEARENVIDALQTMLTPDEQLAEPADRETPLARKICRDLNVPPPTGSR